MAKRSLRSIFVHKSVEQMHAEHERGELKKSLGAVNLVLLGIGCIIGTGIFVLTGQAAALHAGPAIMISFIITGTLCTLVALAYAELASAIPVSGSAYSYSYASLGEFAAWIMGVLLAVFVVAGNGARRRRCLGAAGPAGRRARRHAAAGGRRRRLRRGLRRQHPSLRPHRDDGGGALSDRGAGRRRQRR